VLKLEDFLALSSSEVDNQIVKFFPKKITKNWLVNALGSPEFGYDTIAPQKAVADPIWDFLLRGGKRWRPALMILCCEAVGGKKKQVLPFVPIPELVHNGTIAIDDLEDNSFLRRGKPAMHILFGTDVAVNAGNAMYYLPLILLFRSNLPDKTKAKIYDLYALEMLRLSFGQAMDIYWHKNQGVKVSQKQYLQMCSYKTGSLARFAAELGAILGGASSSQLKALADFAASIGVAFQIQDDILNILPQNLEWGKEIGDDIKEGKRTLMVIRALQILSPVKKQKLLEILGKKEKSSEDVHHAISLLDECGSIEYASIVAKGLVKKSWKALDKKIKDSQAKKMLRLFADYLVERKI